MVVMARLLRPQDFGLFALAGVLLRLVSFFADAGIGAALVQSPEWSSRLFREAFGAALGIGILLAAVVAGLSGLAEALTEASGLGALIRWMSLSFVLGALGTCHAAWLRRSFAFRQVALADGVSYLLGYAVVGLICGFLGLGTFSLVAAALVQAAVRSILVMVWARQPLLPRLPSPRLLPLLKFGGAVSGIGFLEFWSSNVGTLVMGRAIGPAGLGQFNRASSLVGLPVQYLGNILARALLPAFARGTSRNAARGVEYGAAVLAGVATPVLGVAAVAAGPLVFTALGSQWGEAAEVLPYICGAVLLNTLTQVPAVAFEGRALLRPKAQIQVLHFCVSITFIAVVWLMHGKLISFALAWGAGELIRHTAYVVVSERHMAVRPSYLSRAYASAVVLSLPVVGCSAAIVALIKAPTVALIAVLASAPLVLVATLLCSRSWAIRLAVRELGLLTHMPIPVARRLAERIIG